MSLDALIQKADTSPKEETSSGDRIEIVEVATHDPNHALVESHFKGKMLKKEGEALFGKARRLYNVVIQSLLENRASDRPKQFKFEADVGGTTHTTTVNVRENGYSTFDNATLEKVKAITGEDFVAANIVQNISAKVDFSLVPSDKQDEVAAHLMKVNELAGADVVEIAVSNKMKSGAHQARAGLTIEQDQKLNKLVPITCAFGR
ncbi:MAG: hypothetical protein VW879_06380 [Opitutae bacterium]